MIRLGLFFPILSPNFIPMNKSALIPSDSNPFKEVILAAQGAARDVEHKIETQGTITEETIEIKLTRKYIKGKFAKIYSGNEIDSLMDLSPYACWILFRIAHRLEWNDERIKLDYHELGIDKNTWYKYSLELINANVIRKAEKPHWYWVNVTLIIVGKLV